MVATDSYRLRVKETQLEPPLDGAFEANVPARALQELGAHRRSDADAERRSRVGAHDEPGRLRGRRRRRCRSRLIDGQFPNYRQLLPEAYEHELHARPRGAARRRAPHQPDGAEERAAAAEPSPRAS